MTYKITYDYRNSYYKSTLNAPKLVDVTDNNGKKLMFATKEEAVAAAETTENELYAKQYHLQNGQHSRPEVIIRKI
jgi:hypothetical protein